MKSKKLSNARFAAAVESEIDGFIKKINGMAEENGYVFVDTWTDMNEFFDYRHNHRIIDNVVEAVERGEDAFKAYCLEHNVCIGPVRFSNIECMHRNKNFDKRFVAKSDIEKLRRDVAAYVEDVRTGNIKDCIAYIDEEIAELKRIKARHRKTARLLRKAGRKK